MLATNSTMMRWDTNTLRWVMWDGALTAGSLVIGAVTQSGEWNVGIEDWLGSTTPTVGQKAMAASLPVVVASDQSAIITEVQNIVSVGQDATLIPQSDAWWQRITDGTNGPVKVTAAGEAAVAGDDPALVVRAVQLPSVIQGDGNNDPDLPWTVAISDGGTGFTAVKAASTAAVAADKALVVAVSPNNSVSVSSVATEDAPAYTEAAAEAFSQDLAGNLRVRIAALVSDALESYLPNEVRPLSLTSDGRLRTSSAQAEEYLDFFGDLNPYADVNEFGVIAGFRRESFPLARG